MARREWLSIQHKIFRDSGGNVYARPSIEGIGRKEMALGRKFQGPVSELTSKQLAGFVNLRDRKVAEIIRDNKPTPKELYRFEKLANEVVESKKTKAGATFESAILHLEGNLIPWVNLNAPYLYEWEEKGETLWQKYIDDKRARNPKRKFFNDRKHLNTVLLRAFERGIISRRIKIYNPDPETDVGRVLSNEEVKALYQVAGSALKCQILMAFTMGFRKSEILRLEWDRVDFAKREISLLKQHTKTRKPRIVPMNPFVETALTARYEHRHGPFVFPSRYNKSAYQRSNRSAWRAAKRRTHIQARFHDLRHTFITHAVRAGMNPILICKYAGLSQEVMAKVYCHLDTNDLQQVSGSLGGNLGRFLENAH